MTSAVLSTFGWLKRLLRQVPAKISFSPILQRFVLSQNFG